MPPRSHARSRTPKFLAGQSPRGEKGSGAPASAKSYGFRDSFESRRALDGAPRALLLGALPRFALLERTAQLTAFRAHAHLRTSIRRRAPLQSRTVCPGSNCQLLAGTPSGPGGSSATARVPWLTYAKTRGRRTPPHDHDASRKRPFNGRGGVSVRQFLRAGIK